jgi:hypothetical protein
MVLWNKRRAIAYRLPEGRILPAVMVQLRANTRGLGYLRLVPCSKWSAEVWDHSGIVSVRQLSSYPKGHVLVLNGSTPVSHVNMYWPM